MGYVDNYSNIFCGNFDRKVYLCKSLVAGRRLVKAVAKEAGTVYGVEVETLKSLISKEYGADKKILSPYKAQDVIYAYLRESEEPFWKKTGASSRTIAKELHQLFTELELEMVEHIKSSEMQGESGALRIAAIEDIRAKYRAYKKAEGVYEYPDLVLEAIKNNEKSMDKGYSLYLDESCVFSALEQRYVNGLKKEVINCNDNEVVETQNNKGAILETVKDRSRLVQCRGNECDFIFKDILESEIAFEDIAIMLWDGIDIYSLYTKATSMGIPLNMTQGIPLRSSGIFQTLNQVKEFAAEGYSAEILHAMFSGNVFKLTKQKILAEIIVKNKISFGKTRYEDIFIKNIEKVLVKEGRELEAVEINSIQEFFTDLLGLQDGDVEEQRDKLLKFIEQYTYHSEEAQVQAFSTTKQLIYEVSDLDNDNILDTLLQLMGDKTYMSNIAGGVYCTGNTDDIYAKRIYMCGMIAGNMPVSPLVFEEDREVTLGLKTYRDTEKDKEDMFYKMLGKHEGELVFTYESYNVEKLVNTTPNYFYGNMKSNGFNEDITQLQIPKSKEGQDNRISGDKEVGELTSHKEQVKNVVFSASSLEKALECPLRFYVEKILGVREDELYQAKDHQWLAANEKGTFVHDVLDHYYTYVLENNGEEDSSKLDELIEAEKQSYKETYYCHNVEMQVEELQDLEDEIRENVKFFANEGKGYRIHSTEKGMGKDGEVFEIIIKHGENSETIKFTGSIDRVDEDNLGNLRIVDYKTGKMDDYIDAKKMPMKLQAYLYKLAMETICKNEKDEYTGKYVGKSYYYFTKGQVMVAKDCSQDAELLLDLMDILKDEKKTLEKRMKRASRKPYKFEESDIKFEQNGNCKYCSYRTFCKKGGK